MFYVYILFSDKLNRYYAGSTNDLNDRFKRHNAGESKFTSKGCPWILVWSVQLSSRPEAVRLEMKIKKRGIQRFLSDNNLYKKA